jgi:hypothetical protein
MEKKLEIQGRGENEIERDQLAFVLARHAGPGASCCQAPRHQIWHSQ